MSGVSALAAGLSYQELYGWWRILELLSPANKVSTVSIEDPTGLHFDDVTMRPEVGTSHRPEFIQVKFHVDVSDVYSSDSMMTVTHGALLRKAWSTWRKLRPDYDDVELLLITTWAWDPKDPLARHIRDRRLSRDFIAGGVRGKTDEVRVRWWEYLERPKELDFQAFLASLRFRTGFAAASELMDLVKERMELRGLRYDDQAVLAGERQVRQWIIDHQRVITRAVLEEAISHLELRAAEPEPSVMLALHTVRRDMPDSGAEYELDWREYFEGPPEEKGHAPLDDAAWNALMLPLLREVHARMRHDTSCRRIRLRGMARLSPWLAVGYEFRESAGWTLESDQHGQLWRTNAEPSELVPLVRVEQLDGPADVVALGLSISGDISEHVREQLAEDGNPAGRLLLIATPTLGRDAVRDAGDLVALARRVKSELQRLRPRAGRLLLFYWGPSSGAVFVGHQLNATAGEIQLYEDQLDRYRPSFLLR